MSQHYSDPARERFNKLQEQIRALNAERRELSINLSVKYGIGNEHYAKRSERNRLDVLALRMRRLECKLFDLLEAISPRDWRTGVPCGYIVTELTYDDAVTRGALSKVPPCAWGASPAELARFAEAVR